MSTLLIEGGHRLEGRVAVEGNKNAALPLLAACLLTEDECVLTNVPRIGDVEVMARLLADIGADVEGIGTTTMKVAHQGDRRPTRPIASWSGRLRGSVLLLGPLLGAGGEGAHRAPRRRLSGAPHHRHAHGRACADWARARARAPTTCSKRPTG